ncbi:formate dehydrogenase beta subunit [Oxalobacteraceae bacterium GrIS 2.11]
MSNAKPADMTPVINLTKISGTGPKRSQRPVYENLLPPCNSACPAGENIQAWMAHVQAGQFRTAWETLIRDNPMPAVHGRVCYHPCESNCSREELDSPVSIHAIERFLGDQALAGKWPLPVDALPSGKRVLVIGAGPSGLSAAYHLTRLGHTVEIHDAGAKPGGMLHFGIPAYRMPREILMQEITRIEQMGVKIVLNHKVDDLLAEKIAGNFDAVFVAIGAQLSRHVDIPERDAAKVLDAVTLLKDVEGSSVPFLGRRVVVYGGGNTAMDAARTAKRLGAAETLIVCWSDRAHMPVHDFELEQTEAEGIKVKWLTGIDQIEGSSLQIERMEIDKDGQPQPTGKTETLQADAVVLALGQNSDSGFLKKIPAIVFQNDGSMIVGPNMMSGEPGVFGGGDLVPGERSVTIATGQGKKAARHIDAWLNNVTYQPAPKHQPVTFSMLKLFSYSDAEPSVQKELAPEARTSSFAEVMSGLSQQDAVHEAQRCLSCGNCFECDNCLAACPETAIAKLGPGLGYQVDLNRCTGCAVCFDQCPCHAIEMTAEPTPDQELNHVQ